MVRDSNSNLAGDLFFVLFYVSFIPTHRRKKLLLRRETKHEKPYIRFFQCVRFLHNIHTNNGIAEINNTSYVLLSDLQHTRPINKSRFVILKMMNVLVVTKRNILKKMILHRHAYT